MIPNKYLPTCFLAFLGFLIASPFSNAQEPKQEPNQPMVYEGTVGGLRIIEEGQPPVIIHATVEDMRRFREANPHARPGSVQAAGTSNDLTYHGGTGGIGVETAPKVYLVLWGSQWNNNDPSGEAGILQTFYQGVGGSTWLASVTQYCQGVQSGTVFCNGAGTAAGNQSGIFAGVWADNGSSAPPRPRQSQIAAEAVRAAQHFGNTSASKNASVQYVIATATGNSSQGFKTQYCAYHSATSSSYGNIAYTNLPYITDAGASCGANFNGLGAKAGITIVSGHEMAETISDQFPSSGWVDSSGAENGDKCAWISSGQGAAAEITLSTGTFAVQSLWSNAFNSGSGGCVVSYP
jgi:serine protease